MQAPTLRRVGSTDVSRRKDQGESSLVLLYQMVCLPDSEGHFQGEVFLYLLT